MDEKGFVGTDEQFINENEIRYAGYEMTKLQHDEIKTYS